MIIVEIRVILCPRHPTLTATGHGRSDDYWLVSNKSSFPFRTWERNGRLWLRRRERPLEPRRSSWDFSTRSNTRTINTDQRRDRSRVARSRARSRAPQPAPTSTWWWSRRQRMSTKLLSRGDSSRTQSPPPSPPPRQPPPACWWTRQKVPPTPFPTRTWVLTTSNLSSLLHRRCLPAQKW